MTDNFSAEIGRGVLIVSQKENTITLCGINLLFLMNKGGGNSNCTIIDISICVAHIIRSKVTELS